jgi:hypothetical protein
MIFPVVFLSENSSVALRGERTFNRISYPGTEELILTQVM